MEIEECPSPTRAHSPDATTLVPMHTSLSSPVHPVVSSTSTVYSIQYPPCIRIRTRADSIFTAADCTRNTHPPPGRNVTPLHAHTPPLTSACACMCMCISLRITYATPLGAFTPKTAPATRVSTAPPAPVGGSQTPTCRRQSHPTRPPRH